MKNIVQRALLMGNISNSFDCLSRWTPLLWTAPQQCLHIWRWILESLWQRVTDVPNLKCWRRPNSVTVLGKNMRWVLKDAIWLEHSVYRIHLKGLDLVHFPCNNRSCLEKPTSMERWNNGFKRQPPQMHENQVCSPVGQKSFGQSFEEF